MTVTQTLVNEPARFSLHKGGSSVLVRLLAIVYLWLGGQPVLSLSMGAVSAQDRPAAIARVTTSKIHLIMVADTAGWPCLDDLNNFAWEGSGSEGDGPDASIKGRRTLCGWRL